MRAAGALFPGARATVLTIQEPAISPVTTFRVGGALMSPELVERSLTELERELVADAEAAAADGVRLAEAAGLSAEPAVAPGERQPWGPILAAAAERGADVVVCGTRGHGAVSRSVLGSTSSSLLHHAERAVLVVPEADVPRDGPVLVAYDGSPAADAAVAAAGRLLPGRRALVVHAWESPLRHSLSGRALSGIPVTEINEFTDDFETWLREMAEATVADGVERAKTGRARDRRRGRGVELDRLAGTDRDRRDTRRDGHRRGVAGPRRRRVGAARLRLRGARAPRGAAGAHPPGTGALRSTHQLARAGAPRTAATAWSGSSMSPPSRSGPAPFTDQPRRLRRAPARGS